MHIVPWEGRWVNVQHADLSYTKSMRRLLFTALLGLAGCTDQSVLGNLKPDGELVVVKRNGPTTYYLGADEPAGFEY